MESFPLGPCASRRIARVLGVPISAFFDGLFPHYDDTAKLLDVWAQIDNPQDRRLVLDTLRQVIERLKKAA